MASKKVGKAEILAKFFDDGVYTAIFAEKADCAVNAAFGYTNGCPVYAVVQSGAALSKTDAEKIVKVLDMAAKTGNPVVTYYNSIGSQIANPLDALKGAKEITQAVSKLSGVVLQIAVVNGVCGASQALQAANADICVVTNDSEMFFTPTFTAQANDDKLEIAGTAKAAEKAGVAHIVTEDVFEAVEAVKKLVATLPSNNLSTAAGFEFSAPEKALTMVKYSAKDAALAMVDNQSEVEIFEGFGVNAYTAFATVAGSVCGVVSTSDDVICENTASKISRFVRLCDSFCIPVITVVNTQGFVKSSTHDVQGGLRQAARLSATYADATTAKICVVTGKAVGTAYTALCNADITICLDTAVIAPLEVEAAATIIYKEQLDQSNNLQQDIKSFAKKYIEEYANAEAVITAGLADMQANAQTIYATVMQAADILSTKRAMRMPKKHGNMPL